MELSRYIPQLRHPGGQLYTGGQPLVDAWPALAIAGVRTIINLRPASETPGRDEAAEVRAVGLTYINVPIDGPGTLGRGPVAALWQALDGVKGPVLVHCGSGNRCGAMLALAEAWHRGAEPGEALEAGRRAGLTGWEPEVRKLLG